MPLHEADTVPAKLLQSQKVNLRLNTKKCLLRRDVTAPCHASLQLFYYYSILYLALLEQQHCVDIQV